MSLSSSIIIINDLVFLPTRIITRNQHAEIQYLHSLLSYIHHSFTLIFSSARDASSAVLADYLSLSLFSPAGSTPMLHRLSSYHHSSLSTLHVTLESNLGLHSAKHAPSLVWWHVTQPMSSRLYHPRPSHTSSFHYVVRSSPFARPVNKIWTSVSMANHVEFNFITHQIPLK